MAILTHIRPRFRCGELIITEHVGALIRRRHFNPKPFLVRHLTGDWGDVGQSKRRANDTAVLNGGPLLSSFDIARDHTLCIMTESDRRTTTLFLTEDPL